MTHPEKSVTNCAPAVGRRGRPRLYCGLSCSRGVLMSVRPAVPADLAELAELFAAYLEFYQVPRPLPEVSAFLATRLQHGDSLLLLARDAAGQARGFVQLYPF